MLTFVRHAQSIFNERVEYYAKVNNFGHDLARMHANK